MSMTTVWLAVPPSLAQSDFAHLYKPLTSGIYSEPANGGAGSR